MSKKKKFILQFPVDCSFVDKNLAIIEVERFYPETPWSEKISTTSYVITNKKFHQYVFESSPLNTRSIHLQFLSSCYSVG